MSRLLIRGGSVLIESGVSRADVLVDGGRVAEVGAHLTPDVDEVVDASGDLVAPGIIDLHVHFEEPGPTAREGYWTGTQAAAAGGITMFVEHPLSDPPTTTARRFAAKRAQVERSAHVDFALWGGVVPGNVDQLAPMAELGAAGFKAFMVGSEAEYPRLHGPELKAVMSEVARLNSVLVVHAEDEDMTSDLAVRLRGEGRNDPLAWAESRPPRTEVVAVAAALDLARKAGCRIQLAHLSVAEAVGLVVEARNAGVAAAAETCPHFLLLDDGDLARHGRWAKTAPPLRSAGERERLWSAVAARQVQFLASDHAPWERREKEAAEAIWDVPNGLQSLQLMSVLTLDAWTRRGLPLAGWTSMTSAEPARWLGIFPRKGTIRPGSDADIAIYRRVAPRNVRAEELLNRQPWTPFDGMETTFEVRMTLVRGVVTFAEGEVVGPPQGQFVALGGAGLREEAPYASR